MSELVPALKDTLFSPTYEIAAEYAEIGIDALLDNEVLKGIPVVSTLSSICKIGYKNPLLVAYKTIDMTGFFQVL